MFVCLLVAKFRKKKGGVKAHVLYDLEAQVPIYFHFSTSSVHDSKAMKYIPYESVPYYVFDRGYNVFKEVYKRYLHESFFVVKAKRIYSLNVSDGDADFQRMYLPIL